MVGEARSPPSTPTDHLRDNKESPTFTSSPANKNMLFQRKGEGEKQFSFAVFKYLKAISCCWLRVRASKTAHP